MPVLRRENRERDGPEDVPDGELAHLQLLRWVIRIDIAVRDLSSSQTEPVTQSTTAALSGGIHLVGIVRDDRATEAVHTIEVDRFLTMDDSDAVDDLGVVAGLIATLASVGETRAVATPRLAERAVHPPREFLFAALCGFRRWSDRREFRIVDLGDGWLDASGPVVERFASGVWVGSFAKRVEQRGVLVDQREIVLDRRDLGLVIATLGQQDLTGFLVTVLATRPSVAALF